MSDEPPSPGRSPALDVAIQTQGGPWHDRLPDAEPLVRSAALAAWAGLPAAVRPDAPAELSVVLSDDAAVRVLNRDFRGRDKPTNVLSFANLDDAVAPHAPDEPVLLGDVVLALETVLREASEQGKAPGDHLSHLTVHGVLHLLGYDHGADAEAETMEALERRVLAGLGIADPYAAETLSDGSAAPIAAGGAA